jgi:hypothetical protein
MSDVSEMSDSEIRRQVQSEVYQKEVESETTYQIEIGDVSFSRLEELVSRWRVDEIRDGNVVLASDAGHHGGESHTSLRPEQARELGQALVRAADFAENQE